MSTSTFSLRWWRFPHFCRNELVRGVDRMETVLLIVLALLMMLAVPVAGMHGADSYTRLHQQAAAEQADRHPVTATIRTVTASVPTSSVSSASRTVTVTWFDRGQWGRASTEIYGIKGVGDTVPVWLNQRGAVTDPPMTAQQATISAALDGIWTWFLLAGSAVLVFLLARWGLDRLRAQRWERDWRLLDTPRSRHDKW